MTGVVQQIVPQTIEGYLVQLERLINGKDELARGSGRGAWGEAEIMLAGATVMDGGVPSWRLLTDGRVELRGRLSFPGSLSNTAPGSMPPQVLRLPGICAPPGNDATHKSWISTWAPCSSGGSNPGVIRLDVQRTIVTDPANGDEIIYASIYARPPMTQPLTEWIGFDHAVFDPNLYVDVLDLVPMDTFNKIYGRGIPRDDGKYIVAPEPTPGPPTSPEKAPIPEYGIAFIGTGEQIITVIPGVERPPLNLPTTGPTGP